MTLTIEVHVHAGGSLSVIGGDAATAAAVAALTRRMDAMNEDLQREVQETRDAIAAVAAGVTDAATAVGEAVAMLSTLRDLIDALRAGTAADSEAAASLDAAQGQLADATARLAAAASGLQAAVAAATPPA